MVADVQSSPHNLEAEQAVLGAVLLDNEQFDVAAAVLEPGHFFRSPHQVIWRTIARLLEQRSVADLVTTVDALTRAGELETVGGPGYVARLIEFGRSANVEHYARIVRREATRRYLEAAGRKIMHDAQGADEDVDLLIDRAERTVMEIGRQSVSRGDFVLAEDWMRDVANQVAYAIDTKRAVTGVATGIPTLDRWTRGLQPSDLIYVGARPSVGKTSLALQLALEASRHTMTGFVSLEMSRKAIGFRAVALEARIDAFRLSIGAVNDREQQLAGQALQRLSERRLAIDDASGQTPAGVRAKVRRLASRYGLGIVFIDYMQLLRDSHKSESRNQELSVISAGLKDLAKELNIPTVVLSQLSRDSEKQGGNRRPQVWHLRDSGSLEQDADVVLLLHRPEQHEDGQQYRNGERAELIVGKQRNGPTGVIELHWLAEQMRFAELTREEGAA